MKYGTSSRCDGLQTRSSHCSVNFYTQARVLFRWSLVDHQANFPEKLEKLFLKRMIAHAVDPILNANASNPEHHSEIWRPPAD